MNPQRSPYDQALQQPTSLVDQIMGCRSSNLVTPTDPSDVAQTEISALPSTDVYMKTTSVDGTEDHISSFPARADGAHTRLAGKGISLGGLRKLRKQIEALCASGFFNEGGQVDDMNFAPGVESFKDLSTKQMIYMWVKQVTRPNTNTHCCLADMPDLFDPADLGAPTYFISHAWNSSVSKLFDSIEGFLWSAADTTCVWLDFVAINQHIDSDTSRPTPTNAALTDFVSAFSTVLETCRGGTIVVVDVGMLPAERDLVISQIDVEMAECYMQRDKAMIRGRVLQHHGSYKTFNQTLQLELLLQPLSYKVDIHQLCRRSVNTVWRMDTIKQWVWSTDGNKGTYFTKHKAILNSEGHSHSSRALCILAGAGAGKSTISAAICKLVFGKKELRRSEEASPLTAYHFLKYNDLTRLEPVRIIQSLAEQLAKRIPALADGLLGLSVAAAAKMEGLCTLLSKVKEPVVLLIDALDEADPPEQQLPDFDGNVLACGNATVQLITKDLVKLPANFRFIFTTRPDALCDGIERVLRISFPGMVVLDPNQVRVCEEDSKPCDGGIARLPVYNTVVKECLGGSHPSIQPNLAALGIEDSLVHIYSAYHAVFTRCAESHSLGRWARINELLQMGLADLLSLLPAWGVLFYLADHHVYPYHKSLRDWLTTPKASLEFALNMPEVHLLLGKYLAKEAPRCSTEQPPSRYALKYMVPHLSAAAMLVEAALEHLDVVLGCWEFIRHLFKTPSTAAAMVAALGRTPRVTRSLATDDAYIWARHFFHDFVAKPDRMEQITYDGTRPLSAANSPKYKEAAAMQGCAWYTSMVFGGHGGVWPPDEAILKGHKGHVKCVAYSLDGRQLATGGEDKRLLVWNLASGNVAFSSDGLQLATASGNKFSRLWSLAGQCGSDAPPTPTMLRGPTKWVFAMAYHPTKCLLAIGQFDNCITVWDSSTREQVATMHGHSHSIISAAFSPDGALLASGSWDQSIKLWDTRTWSCTKTLHGHTDRVISVCFKPGAAVALATSSDDNSVKLWDVETGACLATFQRHTGYCLAVACSPSGQQLASCSADSTTRLWDPSRQKWRGGSGRDAGGQSGAVSRICYNPGGEGSWMLASCSQEGAGVSLWGGDGSMSKLHLEEGHDDCGAVVSIAITADSKTILSASLVDGALRVWDLATHRCTQVMRWPGGEEQLLPSSRSATPPTLAMVVAPNGKTAASVGPRGASAIGLWSIQGRNPGWRCKHQHKREVTALAFHPIKDEQLMFGDMSGAIHVVNAMQAEAEDGNWAAGRLALEGHSGAIRCLAFHLDGGKLVNGSEDRNLRVWDVEAGACLLTVRHSSVPACVSFSPDGQRIASGDAGGLVRLWDALIGEKLEGLEGHKGAVTCLAFSNGGQDLASGGADRCIRLWRNGVSPLFRALEVGQHASLHTLLKDGNGADIHAGALVAGGADVEEQEKLEATLAEEWPLERGGLLKACEAGNVLAVEYLMCRSADVEEKDGTGDSPLLMAVRNGHTECVASLLADRGADVNVKTPGGATPLFLASVRGQKAVVAALVAGGADVQEQEKLEAALAEEWPLERGALLKACEAGNVLAVELLMSRGADLEEKDETGTRTPLITAGIIGHVECICALLAKGADIDGRNINGRTPLIAASDQGHRECVATLLDKGALVNAMDDGGNTALWWARKEEVKVPLRSHRANSHGAVVRRLIVWLTAVRKLIR
eukprot:gene32103-16616_t